MLCSRATLKAFETEDFLLFAGLTDGGDEIDHDQCRRISIFLPRKQTRLPAIRQSEAVVKGRSPQRCSVSPPGWPRRTAWWFDAEMDKLDRWAEDQRRSLKADLEELDAKIKEIKKEARSAPNLPTKLDLQRQLRQLEAKRNEAWKQFDESSRDLERKKDRLLDDISQRLSQKTEREDLFMIRWQLV